MQENAVEFRHISMEFPGVLANDDVSLDIRKGEVFALVGENGPELVYFNGGEQVMTAEETAAMRESMEIQAITFAPQLLEALHAIHGDGALSAEPGASSGAGSTELQIVFQINGGASPETVYALHEYGDEFAERVLEVIEEAEYDRRRVSFT